MKKKSIFGAMLTSLISYNVLAGSMGPITILADPTWVGTLSGGPAWGNNGKTQTFFIAPEIEKTYAANQLTKNFFIGEFFLGKQKQLSQTFLGQLGVEVAMGSNIGFSGAIWDDADPFFNNYTYGYKLQHTHWAMKGKLLAEASYWWVMPWISVSLGVGFNNAYSFTNRPTIPEAITNPNFTSNSETVFTYTLGAGVQRVLNPHWQIGIGYEFADWGKNQLGHAPGQILNSGLSMNHYYISSVLFNITYTL